ncbi:hypothetical protein CCAND95_190068 [Capnocytophaga canis]|uniref:Uncharacterized protein n=1 Tax=Capnocytophaga canis TaxID=1848903 RepID=A0A0B7HTF2_9FLAO|nr:hypothetical protein CCAND95_190068 [Capnocytophaga canis]CEN47221.1 hypothetical protein CCAND38_420063 [Capnocytophaga canis]CEN53994.1 hypothetical protein CCAND93_680015 [Capnocytophaga canis]
MLKVAETCASPTDSTTTFLFLETFAFFAFDFAILTTYYLVAFFLFATVFLLPFLVRELFFVF